MNLKDAFTEAIVQKEMADKNLQRGYRAKPESPESKVYEDYLENDCWKQLLGEMDEKYKAKYNKAGGGELNGNPPKMAAFASSSRFLYSLAVGYPEKNELSNYTVEEELPTTIAGTANMDGYHENNSVYTFTEAKCREPYGHGPKNQIKRNYRDVYAYLREKMPRIFSCVMEDIPPKQDEEETPVMNVVFFCHGKIVSHFDIKQMISHLLGIATKFLTPENNLLKAKPTIRFLYLLYNPKELALKEPEQAEIMRIYNDTCWCATHYHFEEMFGHIVDFLAPHLYPDAEQEHLDDLKKSISFTLCDQYDYRKYF